MLAPQEELDPAALDAELNELLTQERGWLEVSNGLTRILLGWGVLVGGVGLGIGLLVLSAFLAKPATFWAFFGGLAFLSLAGMFSWGTVLAGLVRCMLYSPERHGVRWYIFVCMICLALGPVLNIGSSFLCTTEKADFGRGVEGLRQIKFDSTGRFVQALCMIGTVGYNVAFILFLRSIGCCFSSPFVARLAELYLACYIGILGATIYLAFFKLQWLLQHPTFILVLALSYFLLFAFYMALLIVARVCIRSNLGKVRTAMGQPVFVVT